MDGLPLPDRQVAPFSDCCFGRTYRTADLMCLLRAAG
jgi:hypothetical protein